MAEPMRSWVDGFLVDCEEYPALIGNGDPDDSYSPEEVVRAVRWLADHYDAERARAEKAEADLAAAHNVIREAADLLAGSESDDPSIGQALALLDAAVPQIPAEGLTSGEPT